jgi:hypothetical protein
VSKYGAIRTEVDGISFASKKEARRYSELRLLERAGDIGALVLQPRYPLKVNGKLICTYVADFEYYPADPQKSKVVEDAKGVRTPVFAIKAKLFEALHGFPVTEV